ncbi:3-hydroxyacyl-CoA dehydrogenase NAD-binding domain-containing protein [Massilia sp. YIM B02763]|uniref:3-hydroxyacyl-CoA dehydrogenase NAD-binding domain-containing protein n=1 Tax=Massilia sp. YIM B02763 TaxID=3050130 RepID=UPI0025B68972|nr:3-hydroxyacyl-CoA dehydrogenase NAD-binding domain-containing protein [Massilia sp. YIM B02763]MDN4054946.1 3-hydroxyacyl-CoA dehydrogenase NAD-binding domain-containing protein [Massilia sp. YIM B02763]
MSADYHVQDGVAVITLNNPPVNGLGLATRTAAVDGLRRAAADPAVRAIVVTGAGKAFSGGADIREFNSPKALTEPTLHTLIRTVEDSPKPVVAAIHTVCMGGGLELALGAHYRVALPGAQVALPEVKLGLLPGAGGTQRLPRVLGLEKALDMIVSGTPAKSESLAGTLLFDALLPAGSELVAGAVDFANEIAERRPLPKVRDLAVEHADAHAFLAAARAKVKAAAGPFPAPPACVEAVAAAVDKPFEEGLLFERDLFLQLTTTTESKALRHAFFAERAASKVADVPADTPVRPVARAAVVGAGTMGSGIAMNFANAGIPVTILETSQDALDKGLGAIRRNYEATVKKGKLAPEQLEGRLAFVQGTLDIADIAQADIVVEAVFEDLAVKEDVFRRLDAAMKPGAILASNTSTLDLDRIAGFTARPQDVIGLHFFSPANVMKLLEIVRGAATGKDVLATALALAKTLRKTGVVSGVCDGFIGNRMIEQYLRQAGFLLDEGALPAQVDRAMERFGFAMGPFRMADLAGNDIGWAIRKRKRAQDPGLQYSQTADLLCERGRFGQKTGAGWYDYAAGDRAPHPSVAVEEMIVRHSADLGIARRAIDDAEIVERLVYALVNEGAKILEDGIAQRASDIDMVYLAGYGFPLFRGGPMFYADTVGLPAVLAAIERFAGGYRGDAWVPAPLLVRLAGEGRGFGG